MHYYLCQSELIRRGWTATLIDTHLGPPHARKRHTKTGRRGWPPMRLYSAQRVADVSLFGDVKKELARNRRRRYRAIAATRIAA